MVSQRGSQCSVQIVCNDVYIDEKYVKSSRNIDLVMCREHIFLRYKIANFVDIRVIIIIFSFRVIMINILLLFFLFN